MKNPKPTSALLRSQAPKHKSHVFIVATDAKADSHRIVYTTSMIAKAYAFPHFLDRSNIGVIVWYMIAGTVKKH